MLPRFAIYYGQPLQLSLQIFGLLCLKDNPPDDGFNYKRLKIFLSKSTKYQRKYENFKVLSAIIERKLYQFYFNYSQVRQEFRKIIYSSLNYRSFKLYDKSYPEYLPYDKLLKEATTLIEAHYPYYSLSVSILTLLFFSKIGLPSELPKVIESLYGQDFLDDLFFPVAFPFTCYEATLDLLLGRPLEDDLHIIRAFLSFLLWPKCKTFLKLIYYRLISAGVDRGNIWITL